MKPEDDDRIEAIRRYKRRELEGAIWAEEGSLDELELLHFLRRYGDSKRLASFLSAGDQALALCPWAALDEDQADRFQDGFRAVAERVREIHDRSVRIEWELREMGWKYDPETKTLKELIDGRRGPKSAPYSKRVAEEYERHHAQEGNTAPVRQHLAQLLGDDFHPTLNDPKYKGRMWNALNNHIHADRH